MSTQEEIKPRWTKRRIKDGYLVWSNDKRTLLRLYKYTEDGSLSKGDGKGGWRIVRGECWAVAVLLSDWADDGIDQWRVVQRQDGRIAGVDNDVVTDGQWETFSNGHETLREAHLHAVAEGDSEWLAEFVEETRKRREIEH